jgi:photosystem II stability/assembly factor-like uncharacterized protein
MRENKMKRLSILCLFLSIIGHATAQWIWQNPKPQGNTLHDVKFLTPDVALAVGEFGTILRTTNRGMDWTWFTIGQRYEIRKLAMADSLNGFIIGFLTDDVGQFFFRTTDGGLTWYPVPREIFNRNLHDMIFVNSSYGYALNPEHLFRTTNGGSTWEIIYTNEEDNLNGISFADTSFGIILGQHEGNPQSPSMMRTTDGGRTWSYGSQGLNMDEGWWDVQCIDSQFALISGLGNICRSTDAGLTWTCSPGRSGGIYFFDSKTGVILSHPYILTSHDGGLTWSTYQTDGINISFSAAFSDPLNAIAVGSRGEIILTSDGGSTWFSPFESFDDELNDIAYTASESGIIVGDEGTVLLTIDGGNYWRRANINTSEDLTAVSFADTKTGFAAGSNGTIIKTTDGGDSWIDIPVITNNNLLSIYCLTPDIIIAAGEGIILRTTDGGAEWKETLTDPADKWCGIGFFNENTGCIAGNQNKILRTTDKGLTWTTGLSTIATMVTISTPDSITGYIAGGPEGDPYIIKTTDAGLNWIPVSSFPSLLRRNLKVFFTDKNNGYLTGLSGSKLNHHGVLYETTDGGHNWLPLFKTSRGLYSLYVTSDNKISMAGSSGTIVKGTLFSIPANINGTEFTDEKKFSLRQNFPNPFNPETRIEYTVPIEGRVSIIVFDALGRKIRTLADEEKTPGTYTINFDAGDLTSGIYFYQLRSGSKIETMKMLLLR